MERKKRLGMRRKGRGEKRRGLEKGEEGKRVVRKRRTEEEGREKGEEDKIRRGEEYSIIYIIIYV